MAKMHELSRVQVSNKRTIVVSFQPVNNKILIGQQLTVKDEQDKEINFFLKGALNMPVEALEDVRDALNIAIEKLEEKEIL